MFGSRRFSCRIAASSFSCALIDRVDVSTGGGAFSFFSSRAHPHRARQMRGPQASRRYPSRCRVNDQAPGTAHRPLTGEHRSLRKISAELAAAGFVNERGQPDHAQSIRRVVDGQRPNIRS
jgi:hypothetical protein